MKLGDRIKRLEQRKGGLPRHDAKQRLADLLDGIEARLATGTGGALDNAVPKDSGCEGSVLATPSVANSILSEPINRNPA